MICSTLTPLKIDTNTFWASHEKYGRICVEVDFTKHLLHGRWLTLNVVVSESRFTSLYGEEGEGTGTETCPIPKPTGHCTQSDSAQCDDGPYRGSSTGSFCATRF